ncbi:MarR family transcriptional regulator [Cerasibacillus terrae]|uniref:MarR family transcriptional regulator n=1 Tax=Cerasibacillus terrae TaxID=2498845 RepID=A0A5C8NL55_9BACI|nr:MarR family transcriptional regulator [Cerasibacillus terrae]TXL62584.1 MarR family transcriptional regulator [Cerasibacillus terrae]
MIPEELVADLEKQLRRISGLIKQRGRKILTNYPITPSQFIALQWIVEEKNITIGELAQKIGLAFSTTTDLVNRMEANGLVRRVKDEQDKRVVRIHTLEKGNLLIKEVIAVRREYLNDILQSFSYEQTNDLNQLLTLLYGTMQNNRE